MVQLGRGAGDNFGKTQCVAGERECSLGQIPKAKKGNDVGEQSRGRVRGDEGFGGSHGQRQGSQRQGYLWQRYHCRLYHRQECCTHGGEPTPQR